MTTLLEAIQKLVAEIKSAEVPWRIAKLLPDLEQAIAQEQANKCDTCGWRRAGMIEAGLVESQKASI